MLIGCAGPTSPFGGLELGSGDGFLAKYTGAIEDRAVQFTPKRQVLHQPADVSVEINTPYKISEQLDMRVVYNDRDVTHAFKKYVKGHEVFESSVKFSYLGLRLSPQENTILNFIFRSNRESPYVKANFLPPTCSIKKPMTISNTGTFIPPENILKTIQHQAKEYKINPSFILGLVHQESGFDGNAVSSSRAVGLTQITPLAADEVQRFRVDWKRYTKFDVASPRQIKKLIVNKKVTEKQDWRLSPERSVEGGLLYLQYLEYYWADEKNAEILQSRPSIDYGAVILASYNSGAARVKNQILDADTRWLEQPKLKEAYRYVNRISSYCYHFSEGEK